MVERDDAGGEGERLVAAATSAADLADWPAAHALWSRALEAMRRAGQAIPAAHLAQFGRSALLHADRLVEAGSSEAAKAAIREALSANPQSGAAHTRLARILSSEGRHEEAIGHWRDAIRLSGEQGRPANERSLAQMHADFRRHASDLRHAGSSHEAYALLCEIEGPAQVDAELHLEMAELAADIEDDEAADRHLGAIDRAAGLAAPATLRLIQVLCRRGRFVEAEGVLTEALLRLPRDAKLRRARSDFAQLRATGRPIWGKPVAGGAFSDRRIRSWRDPKPADGKLRVLFAGDTLYRTNLGCRATTGALRHLIEGSGARIDFTMDVAQWGAYFAYSRAAGRPTVPEDLARLADHARSQPDAPASRALRACDAVVINGEGAFLEFNNAGRLLLSLAYTAKTAFGKPCFIVNHTCDLDNPEMRALAEAVYPLLDDVVFREPVSLESSGYIRARLGLPQSFAADAIHTLEVASPAAWADLSRRGGQYAYHPFVEQPFDLAAPYIVLGGSARWRYQPRPEADTFADYVGLARALARRAPLVVVAIEHQEEPYLRAVAEEVGCAFVGSAIPVTQSIDLIAHAALYVGGRWHSALKAAMGGTPVVVLATNSAYKTQGLLRLFDLEQPDLDFYDVGSRQQTILSIADGLLARGAAERERILGLSREMSVSARGQVRCLQEMARRRA